MDSLSQTNSQSHSHTHTHNHSHSHNQNHNIANIPPAHLMMRPTLDISEGDRETILKFMQLVNTFNQTTQFTVTKPSMMVLVPILEFWSRRRLYRQDKKLKLLLQKPECPKQDIIALFATSPSIELYIDGDKIQNHSFLKAELLIYYQGVVDDMFIYYEQSGSKYNGQVNNLTELQPHGQGSKVDFPGTKEQTTYSGQFSHGKKQGYGKQIKKNSIYEGQWLNNQKNGMGIQFIVRKKKKKNQKQGSVLQVKQKSEKNQQQQEQIKEKEANNETQDKFIQQKDGECNQNQETEIKQSEQDPQKALLKGLGAQKIKQYLRVYRSIYFGPFEKGVKSGQNGKQYTRHGTYVGQWSDGAKNGKGKMVYKSGAVYDGGWKNNFLQGAGEYKDEAGNVYTGQFQGGVFDGEGTMKYINGDEYVGMWSQGRKHGKGVYTYSDGDYYDGQWAKDSAEGTGQAMTNGIYYDGEFSKGMKHGLGEQTNEDGDQIKGIWKNNVRIEIISKNGQLVEQGQQ